jgi:hypothetical protein
VNITHVGEDAIFARTGQAAKGADVEFVGKATKLRDEYAKNLATPSAKQLFTNIANQNIGNMRESVTKYESQQLRLSRAASVDAGIEAKANLAAVNPTDQNINTQIKLGQEQVVAFLNPKNLADKETVALVQEEQRKATSKIITAPVNIMLNNGDYKRAEALVTKYKDYMDPKIYVATVEDIKEKKNFAEHGIITNDYNKMLALKFGDNIVAADNYIAKDMATFKNDDKLKAMQMNSYRQAVNAKKELEKAVDDQNVKQVTAQIDKIRSAPGFMPGTGMAQVQDLVNKIQWKDPKNKYAALTIVDQSLGKSSVDTNPVAAQMALDQINKGEITNKWMLMKDYGSQISYSDMDGLIKTLANKDGEFLKNSVPSEMNTMFKDRGITDPAERGQAWDNLNVMAQDLERKQGRKPTAKEYGQMINQLKVDEAWKKPVVINKKVVPGVGQVRMVNGKIQVKK